MMERPDIQAETDKAEAAAPAPEAEVNAFDIPTFCKRNGIGRTTAYRAAKAGLLTMRKMFGKTVVTIEDEREFRANLPKWKPSAPHRPPQGPRHG